MAWRWLRGHLGGNKTARRTRGGAAVDPTKLLKMNASELRALLADNPANAELWVRAAAERGLAAAQVRLGRMMLEGIGLPKDEKLALSWFKTAARAHDADAINMVGRCYENGWGAAPDSRIAVDWYRKAADAGHEWAQYNLGHMLLDGNGTAADPEEALFWYCKAAGQGHVRAMNLVARCHEEGWGVARNSAAARRWYRASAEGGYFRGQYNWATILQGEGRFDEAEHWFRKAAAAGTPQVRRAIERRSLVAIAKSCSTMNPLPSSPNLAREAARFSHGDESAIGSCS